jgi:hypothetical protein
MGELLLGLVTRILKRVSVMRKSSDDIMRLGRLARTIGGLYGREYSILWYSHLYTDHIIYSGASVGSIKEVVSVGDVIQTTQQEVRMILERIEGEL